MPNGNFLLYSFRRAGLSLEVYRDRIEIHDLAPDPPQHRMVPLAVIVAVRASLSGQLLLELVDGRDIGYELGPAARDVCDVVAALL